MCAAFSPVHGPGRRAAALASRTRSNPARSWSAVDLEDESAGADVASLDAGAPGVVRSVPATSKITRSPVARGTAAAPAVEATRIRRSTASPVVQRLFGTGMKQRVKTGSYPKVEAVVDLAQRDQATPEQLAAALADVARHAKSAKRMKGKGVADGLATLRQLGDELQFAVDRQRVAATRAEAKQIYQQAGRDAHKKPGGFKGLTDASKTFFKKGTGKTTSELYGIGQGESAALSTYTADDYRYINPATAFNEAWMHSTEQTNESKILGERKDRVAEGGLHAAMMLEAMAKLPVWRGAGYRGERMTQARFEERFATNGDTVSARTPSENIAAFWSVSRSRSTATGFAGATKNPNETVSVLYLINVRNARDVMPFSNVQAESEVLCPPGSTITVTKVEEMDNGPAGSPIEATSWYVVHLTQNHPLPGGDYHPQDARERPIGADEVPQFADLGEVYGFGRADEAEAPDPTERFEAIDQLIADANQELKDDPAAG